MCLTGRPDKKEAEKKAVGYYEQERDCIDLFREEYDFLSNFYPAAMEYGGITYYRR